MSSKQLKQLALEQLTSKLRPKHCSDCGTEMFPARLTDPGLLGKFDIEGNRQYFVTYMCPKQRWYQIGWKHTSRLGGPVKI